MLKKIKNRRSLMFFASVVLFFVSFTSYGIPGHSQTITWQRTYGDEDVNYGYSVVQTPDEGYIAVGRTRVNIGTYGYAIRLNKYGDTIWSRTYSGFVLEQIESVESGNAYIVRGKGFSFEGFLMKIDGYGNVFWRIDCGNIYFAHSYNSIYAGDLYHVTKFDLGGDTLWTKDIRQILSNNGIQHLYLSPNNEVIVLSVTIDSIFKHFHIIKLDSGGVFLDSVGFYSSHYPSQLIYNSDNSFVIFGTTFFKDYTPFMAKYNGYGQLQVSRFFDSTSFEYAEGNDFTSTIDHGYVLTGTYESGNSNYYVRLIKVDSNLTETWRKLYGFNDADIGYCVRETKDSGYIVCGIREHFNLGDFYLIKTDKNGYANPPVHIANNFNELELDYKLFQNYPNPFNSQTVIQYDLSKSGVVLIELFNSQGKKVSMLANEFKFAGTHLAKFDAKFFPSGIYYCSMRINNIRKIIKMILIK